MSIRALFAEAMKKDKETQDKFLEIFEDCIGEETLAKSYWELYTYLYGSHFCEYTAYEAVRGMKNKDGSSGELVSKATAMDTAKRMNIVFDHFNEWDWYYTVNMVMSDYNGIGDATILYKIARAWLEDVDVPKGKAFRYWWKVVKCK